MLTKSALRRAMGEAYGAWYWRTPGRFAHKPGTEGKAERVRFILEYRARRADLRAGRCRDEVNARGNVILRSVDADTALALNPRAAVAMRNGMGDRYAFDSGPCKGWRDFPTPQDASYFGVWFNPETRQVFTYCEGDRILVNCPTPESFAAELADAAAFYGCDVPEVA